jgi:hypothetical protein
MHQIYLFYFFYCISMLCILGIMYNPSVCTFGCLCCCSLQDAGVLCVVFNNLNIISFIYFYKVKMDNIYKPIFYEVY